MTRHFARRLCAGFAVALALLPARAHAQGSATPRAIDRRLPLNRDGLVKIFNYVGAVRVVGWARDTVAVTGTLHTAQGFFMGGSTGGIKLGLEGDAQVAGGGADIVVSVPAGARVWVRTSQADVEVSALTGALDVGTVEGRVTVRAQPTELSVESMAGDVEIESSPKYLRVKSAGGRVSWSGSSEDAAVTTVGGAITVKAGVVTRATFESVTGDIRYTGGIVRGGALTLDSHGGEVSAALSRNAVAELEVDAPVSDVLGIRATRAATDARRTPVYKTLGREGFPSARVTLRSFKGRAIVTQP